MRSLQRRLLALVFIMNRWISCRALQQSLSAAAALVTGSTDGIGLTTATQLASQGYTVLLHGRSAQRLERAYQHIQQKVPDSRIHALPPADLSTVTGAEQLAQSTLEYCQSQSLSLPILMNNAGVYSENHVVTSDGTELTFAVNVVATYVVTSLLLPFMVTTTNTNSDSRPSRIVIASSISQCSQIRDWDDLAYEKRRYSAHSAYSESKLLDAMLTMEFSQRLVDQGLAPSTITCNCLDPGTVNTKMLLAGWGPMGIDVEDALDETWLCTSDEVEGMTGKYFTYQHERSASRSAYNPQERANLWNICRRLAPAAARVWDFEWMSPKESSKLE